LSSSRCCYEAPFLRRRRAPAKPTKFGYLLRFHKRAVQCPMSTPISPASGSMFELLGDGVSRFVFCGGEKGGVFRPGERPRRGEPEKNPVLNLTDISPVMGVAARTAVREVRHCVLSLRLRLFARMSRDTKIDRRGSGSRKLKLTDDLRSFVARWPFDECDERRTGENRKETRTLLTSWLSSARLVGKDPMQGGHCVVVD